MGKSAKKGLAHKPGRGGPRPGSGRPPKDSEPLVPKTYRLKVSTVEKITRLAKSQVFGGVAVDVIEAAVDHYDRA